MGPVSPYPCAAPAMPAKLAGMRRLAAVIGLCLGIPCLGWGSDALAAPFAGTGHAALGEKVDALKAKDQALERARKAALEAAVEQLGAGDPAARKQVLANPAVWTRSYRVLRQDDDGATATAMVSVEIDTARLGKALAGAGTAPATTSTLTLLPGLEVSNSGCPASAEAELRRSLLAAGVIRDVGPGSAGPVLAASLQCAAPAMLSYPRVTAVRGELALQGRGGATPAVGAVQATGLGEDGQAAAADALTGLIGQVTRGMSSGTDATLRVKIAAPWPAARVRRLERALRESVLGVVGVTVGGVSSDGAVTLRIDGGLTPQELQERLAGVQVPGATIVVGEVQAHVVHISLQAVP